MIFTLVYATIKAIPGKDGYERMEEKTLRETDETVDAAQASEQTAPVDDTPAEQAEPTEQAVTLREDKVPESEEYDEDEEDDDEEEDEDEEGDEVVEEEVDNTPPYCDKVFGVYRLALYGICFGYGGGLLVTGLFGIITGREVTTSSIPGIVGAVIGYLIGAYATKRLHRRQNKKRPLHTERPDRFQYGKRNQNIHFSFHAGSQRRGYERTLFFCVTAPAARPPALPSASDKMYRVRHPAKLPPAYR